MKQIDSHLQKTKKPKSTRIRKLAILAAMLLGTFTSFAQTTLLSPTVNNGGFESGTSGWTFVQNTTSTTDANAWNIGGTSTPFAGSNAAYITTGATGLPFGYNGTNYRTSHMYRDVTFPSGETDIMLTFQWKSMGESGWDRLLVYLAPTTVTPTSGTPSSNSTTLTGATLLWTQPTFTAASGSNYTQANIPITAAQAGNASANSTMRLIFTWQNDDWIDYTPPASVDDITLMSKCTGGAVATTANSIGITTATFNWNTVAGATGYTVRYKKVSDPTSVTSWATPTSVSGGSSTSLPITGLTGSTAYEYQVSAVAASCTAYSYSSTFTTLCPSSPLPQNQGFNSATMPSCWSVTTLNPGTSTAPAITFETTSAHPTGSSPAEGTRMVRFNSWDCNTGSQMRLMSLPINTSGAALVEVEFKWLHSTGFATSADNVQLQYSLNGTTWTNVGAATNRYQSTTNWSTKTFQLPAAAGNQAAVYVGFLFTSAYGNDCYMDDVKIRKVPTCFAPTAINVSNLLHNSATLGWTVPAQGTPVNYQYVVSPSSTTPTGAGTTVTGTSVGLSLAPNTTYYAFMRSDCGAGDISDWSAPVQFTTPCAPTAMPFSENFAASLPSCWNATEGAPAASVHWKTATADASHGVAGPKTGTHFAMLDVWNGQTAYNPYYFNWAPITLINGNNNLSYYYYLGNGGYTSSPAPLEVQISNYSSGPWTTIYTHNNTNSTFAANSNVSNWTLANVSLNGYNGQTVFIRFKATSNYGGGFTNIGIDDIRILPKTPTGNNSIQCGSGVPTASVVSNTGVSSPVFRWYTVSSGGTPIAGQTGSTFTTSIAATTTWYVCEVLGGIESERVAVTTTVNQATTITKHPNTVHACEGSSITFTATAVGLGTVTYQWQKYDSTINTWVNINNGGQISGATTGTLAVANVNIGNTSYIRCYVNSNCGPAATYPANLAVSPVPAVYIVTAKDTICSNESLTFIAGGGYISPYQWKKNGVNVGTNPSYTASGLVNGDSITIIGTSMIYCPAFPTSTAGKKVYVKPMVPSSVTFTTPYGNGSAGCVGVPLTFTAIPVNGGPSPVYQWKKNGVNVGTNSNIYVDTTLPSGSVISVTMTSNGNCPSPATPSSSKTITMYPVTMATVYAKASPDTIGCENATYTFTSHFTNGGPYPKYQWMRNGQVLIGDTSATYTTASLNDNDVFSVNFSSSNICVFPVESAPLTMHLSPEVVPDAQIYGIPFEGGILFSADLINGGTNPTLQWRKNGKDIPGAVGITYHAMYLSPQDEITLHMVSDMECANPKTILSKKLTQERVTGISTVAKVFNDITLYPNPNDGRFTIRGTFANPISNKQATIEVLNAIGQAVYRNTLNVDGKGINIPLELNSPASGTYMLQLTIDGHKESIRFVLKQ